MAAQGVPEEVSEDVPEVGYYDLTFDSHALPEDIRCMRCTEIYLEFLEPGMGGISPEKTKRVTNHPVLKLYFDNNWGIYMGVQVSMEVDPDRDATLRGDTWHQPGKLVVKPVRYTSRSSDPASTFPVVFPVVRGTSGKDSLHDITEALCGKDLKRVPLNKFSFVGASVESD
ncbi:hypothetical protein IMZ48_01700, partial [Candidatus Bathyarchaeota archaeon]|nr:hypothetical protein [Candidatus Bathyarchaeota archaeon]